MKNRMHRRALPFSMIVALWASLVTPAEAEIKKCHSVAGRSVSFTTTEISATNLDVSPDGKWLAFDMLGDLYLLPISGGGAIRLTSGSAWDSRPVWSPDGRKIAFVSDRDGRDKAFIIDSDVGRKGDRVPTEIGGDDIEEEFEGSLDLPYVEWNQNATALVFKGKFYQSIPMAGKARYGNLVGIKRYRRNGKALYYFVPRPTESEKSQGYSPTSRVANEVWRTTAADGIPKRMPSLEINLIPSLEPPAISENERWVVYRDVVSMDEARLLLSDYVPNNNETYVEVMRVYDTVRLDHRILIAPSISSDWRSNGDSKGRVGMSADKRYAITPDSKELIVTYGGNIHAVEIETGIDKVIPLHVDVSQCLDPVANAKVNDDQENVVVRNMRTMTKSPEGGQLTFSALRRIYTVTLPGGHPRQLLQQDSGQFEPVYSPDGKWIAYVTWSDTDGGHVWRASTDGSLRERLTRDAGYYQSPVWSRDGEKIAFVGSDDVSTERQGFNVFTYGGFLHVYSILNRNVRRLSQQARLGNPLSFSRGGDRLFYAPYAARANRMDEPKYASVNVDGSGKRAENIDEFLPDQRMTYVLADPSARYFAIVKYGNIFLLECAMQHDAAAAVKGDKCRETRITRDGGYDPRWREEGSVLEWTFGNSYFRAKLSDILDQSKEGGRVAVDGLKGSSLLQEIRVDLSLPRYGSPRTIALKGARIITMRGDEVFERGTILIAGRRIEKLGPIGEIVIPESATVVSLDGMTITPGLIDAHAHISQFPRDLLAANHWEPLSYLAFGITTARDPSNGGDHSFAYAELLDAGQMVGPRLVGTTTAIPDNFGPIDALDDAMSIARRLKKLGATFMKYHHGLDRGQRRWIAESARRSDMNFVAHYPLATPAALSVVFDGATSSEHEISGPDDLFADVRKYLVQSGVMLSFAPLNGRGGYPGLYWDDIKNDSRIERFYRGRVPEMIEHNSRPSLNAGLPSLRSDAEAEAKFLAQIASDGNQVMIGSHGDYDGIGMHWEMWAHARGGMSNHQVLAAATINGAKAIGMQADLGSLEVGKVADLLIMDSNPLDDIRNTLSIESIMKDGVLRNAETLEEIWPVVKRLPEWRMQSSESSLMH